MKYILIFPIKIYRKTLSRVLPPGCIYTPSCSEYAIEALTRHGALKGGFLTVRRLLRCNPFKEGGHDPVPDKSGAKDDE